MTVVYYNTCCASQSMYFLCRFLFIIEHVMPLCLTFSWVYTVAMLVRNIVYEKEQRLKEVCIWCLLGCLFCLESMLNLFSKVFLNIYFSHILYL